MAPDRPAVPSRKRRAELAIQLAVQRRWAEAARVNDELLREDDTDVEAANRLAKALTELGEVERAAAVYEQALTVDPGNTIARKNLDRLRQERAAGAGPRPARGRAGTLLLEESGRSAEFPLLRPDLHRLAGCAVGDRVAIEPTEHGVRITTTEGATLGTIDRRAGRRLARLIAGGNRYRAVLSRLDLPETAGGTADVAVHIRETARSAGQADEASFLGRAGEAGAPRAYSSAVRYDQDDPPDMGDEDDDWTDDEEEDLDGAMEERGFSRTPTPGRAPAASSGADTDDADDTDDDTDGDADDEDGDEDGDEELDDLDGDEEEFEDLADDDLDEDLDDDDLDDEAFDGEAFGDGDGDDPDDEDDAFDDDDA